MRNSSQDRHGLRWAIHQWWSLPLLLLIGGAALWFWLGHAAPPRGASRERLPEEARLPEVPTSIVGRGAEEAGDLAPRQVLVEAGSAGGMDAGISGIVTDPTGAPFAGATCQLFRERAPALRGHVTGAVRPMEPVGSVLSDARGAFRLEAPAGFFVLRVSAEDMSPWEDGSLQAGDYRWVRLRPARRIAVRVLEGEGDPVADAEVRVIKERFDAGETAVLVELTNTGGLALLDSVPSGTWFLQVRHPEHVSKVVPLPPEDSGTSTVEVWLAQGIRVVGTVTVADRQRPPRAARVRFETLSGNGFSHEVESDVDGKYSSWGGFAHGASLEISAFVPGFGEERKEVSLREPDAQGEYVVDFLLDSRDRAVVGRVEDAQGRAVGGAEVHVQPLLALPEEGPIVVSGKDFVLRGLLPDFTARDPKPTPLGRMRRVGETDLEGRFEVSGLQARRAYQVLVVSEQHANGVLWVPEGEPGGTTDLGTLRLGTGGRIFGNVRRPDGTPIEGASLHTIEWKHFNLGDLGENGEFVPQRPTVVRHSSGAVTNEEGGFVIQPYPEGEFHLMCLGKQFGPYQLPPGGPIEIVTEAVHRRERAGQVLIVLSVLDERRMPVPKVYAQARRASATGVSSALEDLIGWSWDVGDADGNVVLDTPGSGTFSVIVRDTTGQLSDETFLIEVGRDTVEREVVLYPNPAPSLPLEGSVTSAEGIPLPGLRVSLVPDTGEIGCNCLNLEARTGEDGHFTYGPFMAGNHRLVVVDPDGRLPTTYHYPARPGGPIEVVVGGSARSR